MVFKLLFIWEAQRAKCACIHRCTPQMSTRAEAGTSQTMSWKHTHVGVCRRQEPNYLSHLCCLPQPALAGSWNSEPEPGTEPTYSDVGCWCLNHWGQCWRLGNMLREHDSCHTILAWFFPGASLSRSNESRVHLEISTHHRTIHSRKPNASRNCRVIDKNPIMIQICVNACSVTTSPRVHPVYLPASSYSSL